MVRSVETESPKQFILLNQRDHSITDQTNLSDVDIDNIIVRISLQQTQQNIPVGLGELQMPLILILMGSKEVLRVQREEQFKLEIRLGHMSQLLGDPGVHLTGDQLRQDNALHKHESFQLEIVISEADLVKNVLEGGSDAILGPVFK